MSAPPLALSDEVRAALADRRPVVALETSIVSQGMPWPQNLETALAVEGIVRDGGAVPAAAAVSDGAIHIGLARDMLEAFARGTGILKLSRADLAYALVARRMGAMTVSATMIAARLAGIEVFATGGVGGVHRGAGESFDVSADLTELSRTPVIVVAAGPKAILDLAKTLEVLETLGVPVVTYRSDDFPAFWSRKSGLPSPMRLDSAGEIAGFFGMRRTLGLDGGMLVANPVPEEAEIPKEEIATHIERALRDADAAGITGKNVTPFLLDAIFNSTGGRSLSTNIALVKNNARLAASIATGLADAR
jgi:pseudouridine-5'-phosphate glycosidase